VQGERHQVIELPWFDDVPVRSGLVAGANIRCVIRTGQDDDRNVCPVRMLLELLQHIHTSLASQFEVEQNHARLVVWRLVVQIGHGRPASFDGIQTAGVAGTGQSLAK
jgi:hypothetical protein